MKAVLYSLIFAISLISAFSASIVPKQVLKHGLAAFVKEVVKPSSEENLCFLVFERIAEAIIDDMTDFDQAFESAFNTDLTHSFAQGICEKAFAKFQNSWEPYTTKNNKYVAIWNAINTYITSIFEENEDFKNHDECLNFIHKISARIAAKSNTSLIKSAYADFSKAIIKTGLQYLDSGHDNLPCVKAMHVMFGNYGADIKGWIYQVMAIEKSEDEIGGFWGFDDEL